MTTPSGQVPWRWLLEDLPDHQGPPWPQETPAEEFSDPEAFVEAGSSSITILIVVGWRRGAAEYLYADPRLRTRDVLWLIRPEHLGQAAAEIGGLQLPAANLTVGVYRDAGVLAPLTRYAGTIWGLAVLDGDEQVVARMRRARIDLLYASQFKFDRILEDLPMVVATADRARQSLPMAAFRDRCQGRTALCVAAGPGLDDHLDLLRMAQHGSLVIACDVVASRLEAAGIRVDVVVNVDSHTEVAQRVGQLRNRDALLVASVGVHPDLVACFTHVVYGEQTFGGKFIFRDGADFTHGTNVGTGVLGFAAFLGCSEILMAGYDLSFSREQAYSRLVADAEGLVALNFKDALASGQVFEVPGNGDVPVLTDMCFGLGIDELALTIARLPQTTVYNLNLSTRRGARIPGTCRLPEGWRPRPASGAILPLPGPDPARLHCASAAEFRQHMLSAWQAWCARARTLISRDPIALYRDSEFETDLAAGWEIARHAFAGHMMQAARWAAQPSHVARLGMREAIFTSIIAALPAVTQVIEEALHGRHVLPQHPADPAWEAFRREFSQVIPALPPETFAGAASQVGSAQLSALVAMVPGVPLPPPLTVHDAIMRFSACGNRMGPTAAAEVAVSCWLDSEIAGYLLDVLRRHELLPATALGDPAVAWGDAPAMRAAHALARLATARRDEVLDLARTAVAWVPIHAKLLPRLLPVPGGPEAVCQLIAEGLLPVDDGTAAELLSGHPNPLAAIQALEPYEERLGAGATVAIARRHLALREFTQAEEHAARVPVLDALAEEALGIRLAAVLVVHGPEAMVAQAVDFPRPAVRIPALYLAVRHIAGEAVAWSFVADNRLLPMPPRLIAGAMRDLATGAWPRADRTAAMDMLGMIAEASLLAGAPPEWEPDLRTLSAAATAMRPKGRTTQT